MRRLLPRINARRSRPRRGLLTPAALPPSPASSSACSSSGRPSRLSVGSAAAMSAGATAGKSSMPEGHMKALKPDAPALASRRSVPARWALAGTRPAQNATSTRAFACRGGGGDFVRSQVSAEARERAGGPGIWRAGADPGARRGHRPPPTGQAAPALPRPAPTHLCELDLVLEPDGGGGAGRGVERHVHHRRHAPRRRRRGAGVHACSAGGGRLRTTQLHSNN